MLTGLAVPTSASAKVPLVALASVTASPAYTVPASVAPLMVALMLPS
jgi:hypothetical protein